ncbi:MAG: hypothetical protein MUF31_06200 [Akkermansiaceae bacterium]|nr:hypothetical protein [Akkermansiaceae bacterium]
MKTPVSGPLLPRPLRLALLASIALSHASLASPVYLEFTAGLAGDRTKLTWETEPGARYRIERSVALGAEPGDVWETVAMVTASGTGTSWIDPELPTSRSFYRIVIPGPETHQLHPPVLGPGGGIIVLEGHGFPAGAELQVTFEGGSTAVASLVDLGGGMWSAEFVGSFTPGALSTSVVVTDGSGGTVATSVQPITVTEDGRALDAPPSLPPAAPVSRAARPVAIKTKGTGADKDRVAGGGRKDDCDDGNLGNPEELHRLAATQFAVNVKGTGASGYRVFPASSGLPGEVSFHVDGLALEVPAGPPVSWVMTYRSIAEVESGHGPGWDHAYDISVEALPPGDGATAPRVRVRDGAGRADIYFRQADGTYRCDGHFREGEFSGSSFTLRFPNGGRWEFRSLDGSPAAGKISSIVDPNGIAVSCDYDGAGQLSSVSNGLGQSLSLSWVNLPGLGERIAAVTDPSGRSVSFTYYGGEAGGSPGDLKEVGAPSEVGLPPGPGQLEFSYTTGHADPRLNHNLVQIKDGMGRVLENYEYRTTASPTAADYDTIAVHHTQSGPAGAHIAIEDAPFGTIPGGGRVVTVNDELGRVTRHHFDRKQRLVKLEEFTGFATPGVDSTLTSNLPSGPLRPSVDPVVFTTTFKRNRDDGVISLSHADGSGLRVVFAGDLSASCPVLEKGNAVSIELVGATGRDGRVIRMEHAPGAGTSENARPGGPIRGMTVKGGRNPSGDIVPNARPGGPVKGVLIKIGREPGPDLVAGSRLKRPGRAKFNNIIMRRGEAEAAMVDMASHTGHLSFGTAGLFAGIGGHPYPYSDPDSDGDGSSDVERAGGPRIKGWNGTVKYGNDDGGDIARAGGGGRKGWDGVIYGNPKRLAGSGDPDDADSDGDSPLDFILRPGSAVEGCFIEPACRAPLIAPRVTRLTTAFGEVHQWTYDVHGNCKSWTSPIAGRGVEFDYDSAGRCTRVTLINGGTPLIDELEYHPASGFLDTTTANPAGAGAAPPLVHRFVRDSLGRVTRSIDATGADWEFTYNGLDQITQQRGPEMPTRYTTSYVHDAAGRLVRVDADHVGIAGDPLSSNPIYSTIIERDSRGRIQRIAEEEVPVDVGSATEVAAVGLSLFAAVDFSRDAAGQVTLIEVPAVCRDQTAVLAMGIQYDERGLVHRIVRGGSAPGSVTEEFDYNAVGATTRCAVLGGPGSPSLVVDRDPFHRPVRATDAMGNETVLEYDREGVITTSYFGQTEDTAGAGPNVLLARHRHRFVSLNFHKIEWSYRGYATRRRVEVLKSNREVSPGYVAPCDADPPNSLAGGWISPPLAVFLSRDRKDDVLETERFAPGAPGPYPVDTTEFIHSPGGLLAEVKRNGDTIASLTRDGAGRVVSCSDGAVTMTWQRDGRGAILVCTETSQPSMVGQPSKSFTWTMQRDPLGRVTRVTDGAGNEWTASYDSMGRYLSIFEPGRAPVMLAHESYDGGVFRTLRVIQGQFSDSSPILRGSTVVRSGESVGSTDSHGQNTIHTRDALGRLTRCDFPDGTFLAYTHDARGFVHQARFLDGEIRTLDVDAAGRTTRVVSSDAAFPATEYGWDSFGRLTRALQGSSLVTASYDSTGNAINETTENAPPGLPPEFFSISRSFDGRGRTSITYPDGKVFLEERDALGRLRSISATDSFGTVISPPIVELSYLGHRISRSVQANGVSTEYEYRGDGDAPAPGGLDASFGSVTMTTVRKGGGTLIARVVERRAPDQRVIARAISWSEAVDAPGRRHEYLHDEVGQMIGRTTERRESSGGPWIAESSVTYELDTEGKRISATGGDHPGTYTQSPSVPPGDLAAHQYTTWPRGGIEWDDNGNVVSVETDAGALVFDHDAAGRMTACRAGVGAPPIVSYEYDALDRRIARTEYDGSGAPVSRVRYVHEGEVCIQEWSDDGSGTSSAALTHVASNGVRHCISTRAGTLYYPHGNSVQHWGDPHLNESGRAASHDDTGFSPISGHFPPVIIADASGSMLEGNDCDDAGKFVFLSASGLPTGSNHPIGPIRWMAPESLLDDAIGLTLGNGVVYSPDLGSAVAKPKKGKPHKTYVGHVTLMR